VTHFAGTRDDRIDARSERKNYVYLRSSSAERELAIVRKGAKISGANPSLPAATKIFDPAASIASARDLENFPTTRYQGSKRKIVPWLHDIFAQLEFDCALDLFGGSATVSYLLKRMGKRVSFNDVLRCNYLVGMALIANDTVRFEDYRPTAINTMCSKRSLVALAELRFHLEKSASPSTPELNSSK
jgi:D12 class N6 adenine-specific DNA methyltransferase